MELRVVVVGGGYGSRDENSYKRECVPTWSNRSLASTHRTISSGPSVRPYGSLYLRVHRACE